jgi:hypothetical protein
MSDEPRLTDRQLHVLTSIRGAVKSAPVPERACGDCARCCEGWLSGNVYGHSFEPGRPCFFLEKTCSIYAERPLDPCKTYRCAWLSEEVFPMWMKPSLSNLLISNRTDEASSASYYIVDVTGEQHDPRALAWLERWAAETGSNVEYRLGGEIRRSGSPAFTAGARPR